ncbi:hypothetical protein JYU04_01220 [Dehalococcoides mccartyi]|nr:hypothetical protein [Dehalococcoides mccartyi]
MFRQKSAIFLALAAIMVVAIACSSSPSATATPVPSATTVPTATPAPITLIEIDPIADPVGFFAALPANEASCAIDALGGQDRVFAMLESELGDERLTDTEAAALDACLSDETVRAVFIGQLAREAGGLSDATIVCIGEQVGGMAAAGLFVEEPAADVIISSLKGVFCLDHDEREAISNSEIAYEFGDFGGIDALECVVNGVGPTGLEDLMALASADSMDFATIGDLLPLMIECGALGDSEFENEFGLSAEQVGCVLAELGEDGSGLFDSSSGEPDFSDVGALIGVMSNCGIDLEDLMDGSMLDIDTDALMVPPVLPTIQIESPDDIADLDLPFTEEQITCLAAEIGEDEIANLLAGGTPDLSLFGALVTCEVDLAALLGG